MYYRQILIKFGLVVTFLVAQVAAFFAGNDMGRKDERRLFQAEAVEAKIAHFVVDNKTGRVSFEFLKPDMPEIYQTKAIDAGVAVWSINPQTGEKTFGFVTEHGKTPIVPMPPAPAKKEGLSLKLP